jgi:ADP-heptose:LPS heptosyltransferase
MDKYLGYFSIAMLLPVTRLMGVVLHRDHSQKTPPGTILVVKLLGIGSLFLAIDSIRAVRQKFPNARLILLTDGNMKDAITPLGIFDEVWCVRTGKVKPMLSDALRYLNRCWRIKDLWVVDLEVYSKLTTVYSLATCALNRFGFFLQPVFFRKYFNTHNVFFNQFSYLEDSYAAMAEAVTGDKPGDNLENVEWTAEGKNVIAINNTCSDLALTRKLPEETLASLCRWIIEHTSYEAVLLGAPADAAANSRFLEKYFAFAPAQRIQSIAGAKDMPQLFAFLREKCICVFTIDSAPLHIARHFGVPSFSVWGPTNPGHYLKPGNASLHHAFIYNQVACSPCVHHFEHPPCGGNNFCMKDISAAALTGKFRVFLDSLLDPPGSTSLAYKIPRPGSYRIGK